jgi:hypothetical protein
MTSPSRPVSGENAGGTERRIYRLSATCVALTALAFLVPRFVPNQEGGFASAATAILVFLAMLLGTAVFSLYLLIVTVQAYKEISFLPRLAGIGPTVALVTALAVLLGLLRY